MKLHKKFTFAIVAMIVTGIVTYTLKYDADSYLKALGLICTLFLTSQGVVDYKKNGGA